MKKKWEEDAIIKLTVVQELKLKHNKICEDFTEYNKIVQWKVN
jgi:hypothetical protein